MGYLATCCLGKGRFPNVRGEPAPLLDKFSHLDAGVALATVKVGVGMCCDKAAVSVKVLFDILTDFLIGVELVGGGVDHVL